MNFARLRTDHASFKDPSGRVVVSDDGRVFRTLTPQGAQEWRDFEQTGIAKQLIERGQMIPTHWVSESAQLARSYTGDEALDFSSTLEHERIPFLSFAYEWPFPLLKKAALLHLDLTGELIQKGFILKDSTPFNVQFRGIRPVLIDVLSIERRVEGDPWAGYGQFCDTFLNPLLLESCRGIHFQSWLRGSLEGLDCQTLSKILSLRDVFKPGVLFHVKMRAALSRRYASPDSVRRKDLRTFKFPASAIHQNIQGLRSIVAKLKSPSSHSHWSTYTETCTYTPEAKEAKRLFVEEALRQTKSRSPSPKTIWDLGCNTGDFSILAARYCEGVIAVDSDPDAVSRLHDRCEAEGVSNILPLVMNLANPSPALGWDARERPSLFDRPKPSLVLALALVHHLAVRGNVPLSLQLKWFSTLSDSAVIEFVDRDDPMFKAMIQNSGIDFAEYNKTVFESEASRHFSVVKQVPVSNTRTLYHLARTPSA